MFNHTDIIGSEPFYNKDRLLFDWSGNRKRFKLNTYEMMAERKDPQYPYVAPDLEGGLKKTTGDMIFIADHFSHFTVSKTDQELLLEENARVISAAKQRLNELDGGIPAIRKHEDETVELIRTGKLDLMAMPPEYKAWYDEILSLRATIAQATQSSADGVIDEVERSWLATQLLTFPTIKSFFT